MFADKGNLCYQKFLHNWCLMLLLLYLQLKSPPNSMASVTTGGNIATVPPGQNVNSKPFTSQRTMANQPPPHGLSHGGNPGGQRFPPPGAGGLGFNPAMPPSSMPQQAQFNNKFNNFAMQGRCLV